MQRLLLLSMVILSCLFTVVIGQSRQAVRDDVDQAMLERRVERAEIYDTLQAPSSTATVFLHTLAGAKMSGGFVEVFDCSNAPLLHTWQPAGFALRDALDQLVLIDRVYRWNIENGVVNLLPAGGEPELLKTRIESFEVKDISSLDAIASRLLATPQAKNALASLNLTGGLQIIVRPVSLNPESGYSIKLNNVTLREAMNAITRLHKRRGVWSYREKHCNGKKEYWLDFVVE